MGWSEDANGVYLGEYRALMVLLRGTFGLGSWKAPLRDKGAGRRTKKRPMPQQAHVKSYQKDLKKRKQQSREEKLPWGRVDLVSISSDDDKDDAWSVASPCDDDTNAYDAKEN